MRTAVFIAVLSFIGISPMIDAASPQVRALRVDQAPMIDGILNDACWRNAEPLTNFTQVLPVEGAAPSERTDVSFA
jgi:hypothetical protein